MKKGFMLLLFLLFSAIFVIATTERNSFSVNESYVLRDKNITVLSIDTDKDKAIVCVNGVKGIVDEGTILNGVYFKVDSATGNTIKLDMTYSCSGNCFCDSVKCSNQKCFPKETVSSSSSDKEDTVMNENVIIPSANSVKEIKVVRSSQKPKVNFAPILFVGLVILLVILFLVNIIKKKN